MPERPIELSGGDEELESEIVGRFWGRVRLLAARFLRDAAAAEDVAQETMRRVVEALRVDRIQNRDALPGFVLQTARNICLHYSRSNRRQNVGLTRLTHGFAGSPAVENPLHNLLSRERVELLRTAIDRLDEADKQLLWLFFGEGLDASEVGRRLQLEPGAARVRKHRVLQKVMDFVETSGNVSGDEGTRV
jgi:RNA polymerase sigma-70 factor, ECF subfamily